MRYALLTAPSKSNRSQLLRELALAIGGRGLRVGGFTQRITRREDGPSTVEALGFDGRAACLTAAPGACDGPSVCSFAFSQAAFAALRERVLAEAGAADVLVLDGMGKLEVRGEGHFALIRDALAAGHLVLLAAREDLLAQVVERLDLDEPVAACSVADGPHERAALVEAVARAASGGPTVETAPPAG